MKNRKRTQKVIFKDCAPIQIAAGALTRNVREFSARFDEMGRKLRAFVHRNYFLIKRNPNDYLTLMAGLSRDAGDHLELE